MNVDTHDNHNGTATADQVAPENYDTAAHAQSNGAATEEVASDEATSSVEPDAPAEPTTPQEWRRAHRTGEHAKLWKQFNQETALLVLALQVASRSGRRLARLIKGHPCSREEAKAHACSCCGRSDTDWQYCEFCDVEQLVFEREAIELRVDAEDLERHTTWQFGPGVIDTAKQLERCARRILDA